MLSNWPSLLAPRTLPFASASDLRPYISTPAHCAEGVTQVVGRELSNAGWFGSPGLPGSPGSYPQRQLTSSISRRIAATCQHAQPPLLLPPSDPRHGRHTHRGKPDCDSLLLARQAKHWENRSGSRTYSGSWIAQPAALARPRQYQLQASSLTGALSSDSEEVLCSPFLTREGPGNCQANLDPALLGLALQPATC